MHEEKRTMDLLEAGRCLEIAREMNARQKDLISRCMAIPCPVCNALPGIPCDERAARETPGNQFHNGRIWRAR